MRTCVLAEVIFDHTTIFTAQQISSVADVEGNCASGAPRAVRKCAGQALSNARPAPEKAKSEGKTPEKKR